MLLQHVIVFLICSTVYGRLFDDVSGVDFFPSEDRFGRSYFRRETTNSARGRVAVREQTSCQTRGVHFVV